MRRTSPCLATMIGGPINNHQSAPSRRRARRRYVGYSRCGMGRDRGVLATLMMVYSIWVVPTLHTLTLPCTTEWALDRVLAMLLLCESSDHISVLFHTHLLSFLHRHPESLRPVTSAPTIFSNPYSHRGHTSHPSHGAGAQGVNDEICVGRFCWFPIPGRLVAPA